MALANFFDKAARAASHVLQGFDYEAFEQSLMSRVIGIAFDGEAASTPEGMATLELTVNLLARVYPRLAIIPAGEIAAEASGGLVARAQAINPDVEITTVFEGVSACVAVGTVRPATESPVVYIGSDGWITRVSPSDPVGSGCSKNPFGAAAAACFGAANIFRLSFAQQLSYGSPDSAFSLSLLDYSRDGSALSNPEIGQVDLGESFLVGLGAIGNGAVWAIARLADLQGNLHLIDHESVDITNLQRYVLTGQSSVGVLKVAVASQSLARTGLILHQHPVEWGDYLRERGDWHLDRVAVAVDSARDRCAIQGALPRWVVNAWTQTGNLGTSQHAFLGDQACLMCLYLPDSTRLSEDKIIADAIGLPEAAMEVRAALYKDVPIGPSWIERIANANNVPVDSLLKFQGKSLRAFYQEAVCGGVLLHLGVNDRGGHAEVPMAFQSALAGIMLASELVAHAGGLKPAPPSVITSINLLRPLAAYLSEGRGKPLSGRCICQDRDYVDRYIEKYCTESLSTEAPSSVRPQGM